MDTTKHSEWFNPQEHKGPVHIIGAGAIGSNTASQLVRLGFTNIRLYDFDEIEPHNITNQTYKEKDIGKKKTEALRDHLLEINPEADIKTYEEGWTEGMNLNNIVILCLDSINTRRQIMEDNEYNLSINFVVDMRIGLQQAQMYAANPKDYQELKRFMSNLQFDDDEVSVPLSACGTQLTVLPTIESIVSMGVMNIIKYLKGDDYAYQIITDTIQGITKSY